jgi:hypothetical protein
MAFEIPKLKEIAPHDLKDYAILVAFHRKDWTPTAKDERVEQETRDRLGYSGDADFRKKLINKAWLSEFRQVARSALTFHRDNTLPWTDRGFRILLGKNIQRYFDGMSEFKMRAEVLVDQLAENWPAILDESRSLWPGDLYDPSDYPGQEEIKVLFGIDWSERPIPDSNDFRLKDINPSMQKEIQKRMDADVIKAIREASETPWLLAFEAIERVVETLADTDKTFHYTMISKLAKLVDALPGLNLTEDPRLDEIAKDAKDLLYKMSAEIEVSIDDDEDLKEAAEDASKAIRKDEDLRSALGDDAKKALDKMKGFMGGTK